MSALISLLAFSRRELPSFPYKIICDQEIVQHISELVDRRSRPSLGSPAEDLVCLLLREFVSRALEEIQQLLLGPLLLHYHRTDG